MTARKDETDSFDGGLCKILHYDISEGIPLSYNNILSVLFYTDYSSLSYNFSASFRKKCASETNESLKLRHSCYYHWSRLLHETVHLYGNVLNAKHLDKDGDVNDAFDEDEPFIGILYHGVSYMYFNSFVCRFFSPTSLTRQLEVKLIYFIYFYTSFIYYKLYIYISGCHDIRK